MYILARTLNVRQSVIHIKLSLIVLRKGYDA
jgi:hypothetical protein